MKISKFCVIFSFFVLGFSVVQSVYRIKLMYDLTQIAHEHLDENFDEQKLDNLYSMKYYKKLQDEYKMFIKNISNPKFNIDGLEEVITASNITANATYLNYAYLKDIYDDYKNAIYEYSIGNKDKFEKQYFNKTIIKIQSTTLTNQEIVCISYLNIYNRLVQIEVSMHFILRKLIFTSIKNKESVEDNKIRINSLISDSKQIYQKFLKIFLQIFKQMDQNDYYIKNNTIPNFDKRGYTFEKVTGLLQGFIQNEQNLNTRQSCMKKCEDYPRTKSTFLHPNTCEKRGCSGKLINCKWMSNNFKICPSSGNSDRRYEFVQTDNQDLGKPTLCPNQECSAESWNNWFVTCDYCICLCDSGEVLSDRYFSLRPVVSDTEKNRIVSGVRLIKRNRIFMFQIEEATLEAYTFLSNKNWTEVEEFGITDPNVGREDNFHTLSFNNRKIELNFVKIPKDYVVTGVKFVVKDDVLKISVQGTKFDLKTGKLGKINGWFYGSFKSNKILNNRDLDVPTKDRNEKTLRNINTTCGYVEFTNTGLEQDVAQTTVPFIESLPVTSKESALQGIGLYHKNTIGYGGFIAPILATLDKILVVYDILED